MLEKSISIAFMSRLLPVSFWMTLAVWWSSSSISPPEDELPLDRTVAASATE